MKKGIFTLLSVISGFVVLAQEMNVHKTDGSILNIQLADIEKITFEEGIASTVTDIENNVYKTVVIGTQTWMAENLKTTKYRNGEAISTSQWSYPNNAEANKAVYGLLYQWNLTTDQKGVCPSGWHVPTDAEFTVLENFIGGISVAGGKLKETGLTHWTTPNLSATDAVGFKSLPAGDREGNTNHSFFKTRAYFWTATPNTVDYGYFRWYDYNFETGIRNFYDARGHMSIRCLKD